MDISGAIKLYRINLAIVWTRLRGIFIAKETSYDQDQYYSGTLLYQTVEILALVTKCISLYQHGAFHYRGIHVLSVTSLPHHVYLQQLNLLPLPTYVIALNVLPSCTLFVRTPIRSCERHPERSAEHIRKLATGTGNTLDI